MPRYTVYYRKSIPEDPMNTADIFIEPGYYNMGEFEASSLDELSRKMQGEVILARFRGQSDKIQGLLLDPSWG